MNFFNTPKQINSLIKDGIVQCSPMSIGKIGIVESVNLDSYLYGSNETKGSELFVNAGVYTTNYQDYVDWCESYLECVKSLSYIMQWSSTDKKIINQHFKKKQIFKNFEGLEPFTLGEEGWHYSLKDKKVLCVSPFTKTILSQAIKFKDIWPGANIGKIITVSTPHSEALTGIKPVSWKQKLNLILEEIDNLDFDFATVGCGGLSLHVCDHIKKMGKPSIHLGGGNQLLYGIMGKRWDEGFKNASWYGTSSWTRPLKEDTPQNKNLVENGCYW